jgi:hypothetical protein
MKNLLGAAAILAGGLFALSGAAGATSLSNAANIGSSVQGSSVQKVDFRLFRNCYGPRWDRRCHGGPGFIFRRDHDRRHYWHGRDRYWD